MKIYYWSPHISHVATVNAVINSIKSVQKYSYGKIKCILIDAVGEWREYQEEFTKKNIETYKLYRNEKYKSLPRYGFIRSRTAYWIIFLSSIFSLKKIINSQKPDFLIIHLITSLPILLSYFFNLNTKLILRISGFPKLNFFRLFVWKVLGKNIHKVCCPTVATKNYLIEKKIFNEERIFVLRDPILEISKINKKKNKPTNLEHKLGKKKYLLSVGRITKQKNYFFLIECFSNLLKKYPDYNLVIVGDGEDKKRLKEFIHNKELDEKVHLLSFQNNIFNFMKNAECFILSSLWEDPGWVLIEAASVNKIIISSDCPNGPVEFLSNGKGGYLYKSNDKNNFLKVFNNYKNDSFESKNKKIKIAKRSTQSYTLFRHYCDLIKNLQK